MITVLVIEDEEPIDETISVLLTTWGFNVISASDFDMGLCLAKLFVPNFVFYNLRMPALGYSILKELSVNPTTAKVPFIFITNKATQSNVYQSQQMENIGYLTKPFGSDELLELIVKCLIKRSLDNYLQVLSSGISEGCSPILALNSKT